MPPLLCPSPNLIDQSFPRDEDHLSQIAEALGNLEEEIRNDRFHLIITDFLKEIIMDFDWNRTGPYPLLIEIQNLLSHWSFVNDRVINIDVSVIQNFSPHPLPQTTVIAETTQIWAEEVGKMLVKHDENCKRDSFFIGIACESAFSGHTISQYPSSVTERVFPIIGPNSAILEDAYDWIINESIFNQHVSFRSLLQNYKLIGGTTYEEPFGDSHYHIFFGNYRWTVTRNVDPIPDDFLRELVPITKFPLNFIKHSLINGCRPLRRLRI